MDLDGIKASIGGMSVPLSGSAKPLAIAVPVLPRKTDARRRMVRGLM